MRDFIGQIKQNIISATIMFLLGATTLCVIAAQTTNEMAVAFPIEFWIEACDILDFFFALIVVLPFTWRMYFDRKDNFLEYISIRTSKKRYIASKVLAGMLTAFLMVYFIYFISLIYTVCFVDIQTVSSDTNLYRHIFGEMQAHNPIFFGAIWCAWKAFVGAVICGFGYLVALLVDNIFVISLAPFIYSVAENFVTGTLGVERYSLTTTYILNRLSPTGMGVRNYFVGVITFVLAGGVIVLVLWYRKRRMETSEEIN